MSCFFGIDHTCMFGQYGKVTCYVMGAPHKQQWCTRGGLPCLGIIMGAPFVEDLIQLSCICRKVRTDPGRDFIAGLFSGLIVIGTVNICWCTK